MPTSKGSQGLPLVVRPRARKCVQASPGWVLDADEVGQRGSAAPPAATSGEHAARYVWPERVEWTVDDGKGRIEERLGWRVEVIRHAPHRVVPVQTSRSHLASYQSAHARISLGFVSRHRDRE